MCCIEMYFLCSEELFAKTAESLPGGYGWGGGGNPTDEGPFQVDSGVSSQ